MELALLVLRQSDIVTVDCPDGLLSSNSRLSGFSTVDSSSSYLHSRLTRKDTMVYVTISNLYAKIPDSKMY